MQIVVPMAGAGSRFADAGYSLPKPLIPVGGVPMVVKAIQDLPAAQKVVLLVRQEHIEEHRIDDILRKHLPGVELVPIKGLTTGQATTVSLAEPALDPDQPVIVSTCDNTHVYDQKLLSDMMGNSAFDALIWTYRNDPRVSKKPESFGWVQTEGTRATHVSCKVPLSATPMHDHAVTGFFSFSSAKAMIAAIKEQERRQATVNGELYMDTVPNVMIEQGQRVEVFEVDKYIGWGTPEEYEYFRTWERYFRDFFSA